MVAAGVEARGEAHRLLGEAADRVGGKRAGNPVRPQMPPLADGLAEPAAELMSDRSRSGSPAPRIVAETSARPAGA